MIVQTRKPETGPARRIWKAINDLIAGQKALMPQNSPTIRWERTSVGVTGNVVRTKSMTTTTAAVVKQYRYKSMTGDTLVCHEWNGTTEGTTDITIKKPYLLRRTVSEGKTINYEKYPTGTISVTVSFPSSTIHWRRRVNQTGYAAEDQEIIPPYNVDDLIYAMEISNGSGRIDLNSDGRAWARV